MKTPWMALSLVLAALPASAQHTPYGGQQTRAIKSLSDEELQEVRRGGGMGFAKPAELNGLPGPSHLLELAEAIGLTPSQTQTLQQLFRTMEADAIAEGEKLIAAEKALDEAFQKHPPTDADLRGLITRAEASRASLRYIHLVTHLHTPALLTPAQIARYNELRGYGKPGCSAAPAGHDPALWRQHQGC